MGMCESENKQSEITNEEMIQKQNELKTICLQLKLNPSQIFNSEFLEIIINHSETKDGFISNEIREILYQYLFNVKIINKTTKFEYCTLIIDDEKKLKYYHNFINWKISNLDTLNSNNLSIINDPDTIKKDIPRGIIDINSIQSNFSYKNNLEKSTFSKYTFFSSKTFNYNYYQGCLFIYFYFIYLFKDVNYLIGISCLQKYFEFFLKDFLLNDSEEKIGNLMLVTMDFIKIINPEIHKILEENSIFPHRCIELILTSFIKEDFFENYQEYKFRFLDFLICHKPYFSFLLSAFYIIYIIENLNCSEIELNSDLILEGLQNYKFNSNDYENIIVKCSNFDEENFSEIENILNKYKDIYKFIFHKDNLGLISYLIN
jgi:hypothetical protein